LQLQLPHLDVKRLDRNNDEYWKDIEEITLVDEGDNELEDALDQIKQHSNAALTIVSAFK
jgi:hypothetical protein